MAERPPLASFELDAKPPLSNFEISDEPSTTEDVAKSLAVGVPKGAMTLAGTSGDIREAASRGAAAAASYLFPGQQTITPEGVSKVIRHVPLLGGPTSELIRSTAEKVTGPLYEPKTTAGEYAQTVGEFLPSAMIGPGSIARRAVMGAVVPGLTSEAAGQATKGTELEPYARFAGAVTPSAIAGGASKLIAPSRGDAVRQAHVANLQREGVKDLTAGDVTGSTPLRYAEQQFGDITGAGSAKVLRGKEQFTRAALRKAGVDAERATPETIEEALRVQDEGRTAFAKHTLQGDPQLGTDLGTAVNEYNNLIAPGGRSPSVGNYLGQIIDHLQANNTIPGKEYLQLRSDIERAARTAGHEQGGLLASTLRSMKVSLDDAFERSLGRAGMSDEMAKLRTLNRQYRNLLAIERAITAPGENARLGLISPMSLRAATVNQGRRNFARGLSELGNLAGSGEAIMKPLPQSGTAPRAYMMSLPASLGAAGFGLMSGNIPLAAIGMLGAFGPPIGGRMLMSGPVQRYLTQPGSLYEMAAPGYIAARRQ